MYKTRFEETEIGNNYDMTLLVVRIEERTTKKGDPYCRLTLSDGKTQQEANLFNNNTRESLKLQGVTEEKPVDVRLKCTEFQNQKNYTVDSINPARLTDEEKATLIKMPPLPRQQMLLDMIRIVLDSSGRQYDKDNVIIPEDDYSLTALTVRLISKNSKAFSSSSAAKSMHHNLMGGLLYHTYRMVKAAYSVCDIYTTLNRELLVCGTALHDIGKIEELSTSELGAANYTPDGRLFGHALIGIEMIDKMVADADSAAGRETYNREDVRLLKHLIASHHGTLEWGAITLPAVPEAMVLHNIDMIDSRMYMYEEGLASTKPGSVSDYINGIAGDGRSTIYRPQE
jgi:3'-5' exoribonuclease